MLHAFLKKHIFEEEAAELSPKKKKQFKNQKAVVDGILQDVNQEPPYEIRVNHPFLPVKHHGVVCGRDREGVLWIAHVIHNIKAQKWTHMRHWSSPGRIVLDKGTKALFRDFEVVPACTHPVSREKTLQSIRFCIGKRWKYQFLGANCETFCQVVYVILYAVIKPKAGLFTAVPQTHSVVHSVVPEEQEEAEEPEGAMIRLNSGKCTH